MSVYDAPGNYASLDYIRRTYAVDARVGGRVRYSGNSAPVGGTITGAAGQYLLIRLDCEDHSGRYHPTWKLEYLPKENGSAA